MKTYKSLKHLEKKAISNNGKKVFIWDDEGIKVNGKKYFMFEYGNLNKNLYVTFRNLGRRGKHKGISEPLGNADTFITIEYKLNSDENNKGCLFEFVLIRENY